MKEEFDIHKSKSAVWNKKDSKALSSCYLGTQNKVGLGYRCERSASTIMDNQFPADILQ